MQMVQKRYNTLDILKFILSFFVVFIHSGVDKTVLSPLLRTAVPLFFIIFEWLQERIRPVMHEEVDQQFLKELERSKKEKQEAHEA